MALLPERNKRGGYKALRKINDRNYQYSGPIYPYVEQVLPVYGGGGGFGMTGTQPVAGGGFVTSSGYGARDIGSVRNDISQKAIDYSVGMQDANQRALDEYVAMMSRYGMQPDRGVINKYAQTMTQPSQASLVWGGGGTTIKQGKLNKAMEEAKTIEAQRYIVENQPGGIAEKLKELKAQDLESKIKDRDKKADAVNKRVALAEANQRLKELKFETAKATAAQAKQKTIDDKLLVTSLFEMAANADPEVKAELTKFTDDVSKGMPIKDALDSATSVVERRNKFNEYKQEQQQERDTFAKSMATAKNEQVILAKIQDENRNLAAYSSESWLKENDLTTKDGETLRANTAAYIEQLKAMLQPDIEGQPLIEVDDATGERYEYIGGPNGDKANPSNWRKL